MAESTRNKARRASRVGAGDDADEPSAWRRFVVLSQRVLLVGVVLACTWGALEIRERVLADPRFRVDGWALEFGEFPSWVTERIRAEVESSGLLAGIPAQRSVFSRGILAEVRDDLMQNSWVHSVADVRLVYPGVDERGEPSEGGLVAELVLRRPIAAVSWNGSLFLADAEGRRLGEPYATSAELGLELPIVHGSRAGMNEEPPAPGGVWSRREVLEGLAVARELYGYEFHRTFDDRYAVEEIDVSNVGGRRRFDPEIVLRTRGFPPLAWGRSPISRGARVCPVDRLLANLDRVLRTPPERLSRIAMVRLYTEHLAADALYQGGMPRQ